MRELADQPFDFVQAKSGLVMIRCDGKTVKTIKDKEASRFLEKVEGLELLEAQLLMAKITGQFKFGNERISKDQN